MNQLIEMKAMIGKTIESFGFNCRQMIVVFSDRSFICVDESLENDRPHLNEWDMSELIRLGFKTAEEVEVEHRRQLASQKANQAAQEQYERLLYERLKAKFDGKA